MESLSKSTAVRRMFAKRFFVRALVVLVALFAAAPVFAFDVDLVVNNSDTGFDPVAAGGIVQYVVRVDNNGSSSATGVTLADTLPSGTTFVNVNATQGACAAPVGGVLTCDLGSIVAFANATVTIQVQTGAAGVITNSATANSDEVDSAPGNNTNVIQSTTVNQGADLALTLTQSANTVTSGATLSYTLGVTNNGPSVATNVVVSGTLPPGFTVTGGLPSGCSVASTVLTCNVSGSLPVSGSASFGPINGAVSAAGGSTMTFAANVTVGLSTAPQDPNGTNNGATVNASVLDGSDVSISKTASTSTAINGNTLNFLLVPHYTGENPTGVVVTDTVPTNFSVGTPSGTGWACSVAGQTVTCTRALGGMAAGANQNMPQITIPVTAIVSNPVITNTATVSSTLTDPQPANNSGSATLAVLDPSSDLQALKTGPTPALATVGSTFNWSISMKNNGTAVLTGTAKLIDSLPLGVIVTAYVNLNGWTCDATLPFTPTAGNNTLTCTREYTAGAPLAVNGTTAPVIYTVQAVATGTLTNTMCVASAPSVNGTPAADNNPGNNCASSGVSVQASTASSDLSVIKTVDLSTVAAGDVLTYRMEVVNSGPQTSVGVTLADQFDSLINSTVGPTGDGFIGTSITNAVGATCTPTVSSATGITLNCAMGNIPVCTAGSTCPVVTVQVRPGGDGGVRTNTAYAVSTTTADPNYDNNTSSVVSTTVDARADLTVINTGSPTTAIAGQPLTYVLTVKNGNYSKASAVTVSDVLPLNVTFVSATAAGGGTCTVVPAVGATTTAANQTLQCGWASINSKAQQTVTIIVRPNDVTQGTTLNALATAATTTTELDTTNNTGASAIPVANPVVDILGNIVDNPDPVAVGDTMTYTLTINNNGPSFAENANFTASLPTSLLSFQSLNANGLVCTTPAVNSVGGTITCQAGGLANGANKSVVVTMLGVAKGTTQLSLVTSSDEVAAGRDSLPGNNNPTESTTVRTKADMQVVSKTPSASSVGFRQAFSYAIVVANNGPGVADVVSLSDTLPAGMILNGTPTVAPNAGFPSLGACTGAAGATTFTCALGDNVAVNATTTITVPVIVTTAPATSPFTVPNTATVTTVSLDPIPLNNSNSGNVQVTTSSIAGTVYNDRNGNGVDDAGEPGIAGVAVHLAGTAIDGTAVNLDLVTDASGNYTFIQLPAGTYTVTEAQPAGWLDGTDKAGTAGGTPVNPGDSIGAIALPGNAAATGYTFGELSMAQIGGQVYRDLNDDGLVSGGSETGIAGVTVALSGTDDRGQTVALTTTTDGTGNYSFLNLRPGTYNLVETQPVGFLPGKATAGTGMTTAGTPSADGNTISAVSVAVGDHGAAYNFGELPPTGLSGSVYIDANRNGVHDASETAGVTGVTLTLTGTDDLGHALNLTTLTDGSGTYSFTSLRPGTYQIFETQPAQWTDGSEHVGTVGGTADGTLVANDTIGNIVLGAGQTGITYDFGEMGQGLAGFVYVDANENGVRDSGETGIAGVTITVTNTSTNVVATTTTDASGAYMVSNLPAGTYRIAETQPTQYLDGAESVGTLGGTHAVNDVFDNIPLGVTQVGNNYNFGELAGHIGGTVFIDSNNNGVHDTGEPGIAAVTVVLTGTDVNGNPVNQNVLSDASGNYVFNGLLPSNGAGYTLTETQPPAYADGLEHVGNLGGTAGAAGTSVISGIIAGAGAHGTAYDFGELTGGISGTVYVDANNNGVHDAGEKPIAGVSIRLTGTDVNGAAIDKTVVTGADGNYVFSGLTKAGATGYTAAETQPANYIDGKKVTGQINGTPCAVCDTTTINRDAAIPFDPGKTFSGFDFPELQPSSLAGTVYDDVNGNKLIDSGEGLGGVTVTLTGTNDLGQPVSLTTTTAADGTYSFPNLRPGTYSANETQPAGLGDIGTHAGTSGGSTGINTISSIVLPSGTAATGYDFLDHGSVINGTVYFDKNGNGKQDQGEAGLPGVTITLTGAVTRTVTTGADGSYQFAGLVAGTYAVNEIQPPLYKDGGVQIGSAGGIAATNAITRIALPAGTNGINYNFPELAGANGSIAGTVWLNQSGGSSTTKTPNEPGLAGWIAQLFQNGAPVPGVAGAITDASGNYLIGGVTAGGGYEIRFMSPNGVYYGYPVSQDPDTQWNGKVDHSSAIPSITGVTVGSAIAVTHQDLPLDPSGVIYDSVSRQPLAGARVTLIDPSGQPVSPVFLAGGSVDVTQTTGANGFYQFLLLPGAPNGTYTLRVEPPVGYLPPPSGIHAPAGKSLTVPGGNTTYLVSPLAGPPASGDLPPYYLAFVITPLSTGVAGNHIPVDPVLQGALRVRKTTTKVDVTKGDLVPYTIEVTNTLAVTMTGIAVRDLVRLASSTAPPARASMACRTSR
jgi:uncharacterized repeat protein (TIGR01451 family)